MAEELRVPYMTAPTRDDRANVAVISDALKVLHSSISIHDSRTLSDSQSTNLGDRQVRWEFRPRDSDGISVNHAVMVVQPWQDKTGGSIVELAFTGDGMLYRVADLDGSWSTWRRVWDEKSTETAYHGTDPKDFNSIVDHTALVLGGTANNAPVGTRGFWYVENIFYSAPSPTGNHMQRATSYASGATFVRVLYNGAWTAWREMT